MEDSNYHKVHESLYTFTSRYNRRPTAIVMHHKFSMVMILGTDFTSSSDYSSLMTVNKLTVRGVPVYRTSDIDEATGFTIY